MYVSGDVMAGGFGHLRIGTGSVISMATLCKSQSVWSHYYLNYRDIRSTLSISICPVRFLSMKIILSELYLL